MKELLLHLFILLNITAFSQASPQRIDSAARKEAFRKLFPDSSATHLNYINDFENIFTGEQTRYLDSLLAAFKRQDTFEIVIVTIDTTFVERSAFDSLVYQIARRWGIGRTVERNGVVIGISRGYGHIRIYNGYNVSSLLSYKDTKLLIDLDFVPFYKKKNYYEGTVNGVTELMKMLVKPR